jgi:FtsZ-interacting cell division protein ZipA
MRTVLIVVLVLVLAAAIAAGLAGLWPNLHDRSSVNDRRERVRIASAVNRDTVKGNLGTRATWGNGCSVVVNPIDWHRTACDL